MRLRHCIFAIAIACMLGAGAHSQTRKDLPNLEPKTPRDMRLPTITYELVLRGETEARHVLSVDSAGNAAYRTRPAGSNHEEQPGESRILKFTVSQPTCTRIFELARQANNFGGDSSNPPLNPNTPIAGAPGTLDPTFARTSARFTTLSYSYGPLRSFNAAAKSVRNSVTFTKPPNAVLQELTSMLERMADSLERGQITEAGRIVE